MPMIGVAALTIAAFIIFIWISLGICCIFERWKIWIDERSFRPQEDDEGQCEDEDYLYRVGINED